MSNGQGLEIPKGALHSRCVIFVAIAQGGLKHYLLLTMCLFLMVFANPAQRGIS
jgi:hypothetical protein